MATKRKDGRLQSSVTVTDYFTGDKKKIYIYGYTEKELEAERKRVKEEAEKALLLDRINPTFEAYAKEVIDSKLQDNSINDVTYESYESNLNNHIFPYLPKDIKVSDVAAYHIKFILKSIEGSRTRNYTYTVLNIIFQEALFEHLISVNPCQFVRKPKHESEHAEVITPDDYQAIISEVKGTQWEYAFNFALHTGCRRGEICALRWRDIDLDAGLVKITTAQKKTKRKGQYEGTTKSAHSVRTLPLANDAIKSLREWRTLLKKALSERQTILHEDSFVFRGRNIHEPMPIGSLTRKMYELKKKLELPDNIRMHSYRRTMATNLAVENIAPKKLQHALGHASAAFSLDVYVKNSPEMLQGVAEASNVVSEKYTKRQAVK